MTTAIYLRVSSRRQAENNSTESQEHAIRAWLGQRGLVWDDCTIYADKGLSGRAGSKRPEFDRMTEAIRAGQHDRVIAYSLSRLGRSTLELLRWIEVLKQHETDLVLVTEGVDGSTAMGRAFLTILMALAEMEAEQIVERSTNGIRAKMEAGEPWGGARVVEPGRKGVRRFTDEQEARIERMAKRWGDQRVAERVGCHVHTIANVRRRRGRLSQWASSA
jgi:DNA invertase Pin-like site-specific DNA recombinase